MIKNLDEPIRYLKGIGPKRAISFAKLGINTIEDLLYFFPRRYEDRTHFLPISRLKEGDVATLKAQVLARGGRSSYFRRSFSIIEIMVGDETGKMPCVWFNQPYLRDYFKVGSTVILYGKIEKYNGKLQMSSPEFELFEDQQENNESLSMGRIVPVYKLPQGLGQRSMRKLIKLVLDGYLSKVVDSLPFDIRSRNKLMNLAQALINIHYPQDLNLQKQAYQRLSFEEFFLFELPIIMRKLRRRQEPGISHVIDGELTKSLLNNLPFELTGAQRKVIKEISFDMGNHFVMQRLLQGDVGSGKTVVALHACLCAVQGSYQVAFMAPTEILARQHYNKISSFLALKNQQTAKVKLGLLASSLSEKEKAKIIRQVQSGDVDLLIGTHALLEQGILFKKLGLVVIDEQHKFGVAQRSTLVQKGMNPDTLIMTATPIPRTLAITMYADLDISVINEMPAGRLPVETLYYPQNRAQDAYKVALTHIKNGNQVFIVYPVIEDSYALDIQGAKQMYEVLKNNEFKDLHVGLVHGRMAHKEQSRVMKSFVDKELDILIATTVVEVGIDIPAATCMIIEHAERFGLAQLHQLRGRVGRGSEKATCILISDASSSEAKSRIEAMVKFSDGFSIAEQDLKIRGPGEFFGARQHGLTELKIGNPLEQMHLLKLARQEAIKLLSRDPQLQDHQDQMLQNRLKARFPDYQEHVMTG